MARTLNSLGALLLQAGKREQAVAALERGLAVAESAADGRSGTLTGLLLQLGAARMMAKQYAAAEKLLARGIELAEAAPADPALPSLRGQYARVLTKLGNKAGAKAYAARAAALEPVRHTIDVSELR